MDAYRAIVEKRNKPFKLMKMMQRATKVTVKVEGEKLHEFTEWEYNYDYKTKTYMRVESPNIICEWHPQHVRKMTFAEDHIATIDLDGRPVQLCIFNGENNLIFERTLVERILGDYAVDMDRLDIILNKDNSKFICRHCETPIEKFVYGIEVYEVMPIEFDEDTGKLNICSEQAEEACAGPADLICGHCDATLGRWDGCYNIEGLIKRIRNINLGKMEE